MKRKQRESKYLVKTEQRIKGQIVEKTVRITRSGYIKDAVTSEEKSYNTYLKNYRERSKQVAMGPRLSFVGFLEYKRTVEILQKRNIIKKPKSYASYIISEQEEVSHKEARNLSRQFVEHIVKNKTEEGKKLREKLESDPLYQRLSKLNQKEFYKLLKEDPNIKDQLFTMGDFDNPVLYTKHKRKYRKEGQSEFYYTPNWLHDSP